MMFVHGHDIERYSLVWVMIEGVPTQIKYLCLLPYNGFEYYLPDEEIKEIRKYEDLHRYSLQGWRETHHCSEPARFAYSKIDLINAYKERLEDQIYNLQREIIELDKLNE